MFYFIRKRWSINESVLSQGITRVLLYNVKVVDIIAFWWEIGLFWRTVIFHNSRIRLQFFFWFSLLIPFWYFQKKLSSNVNGMASCNIRNALLVLMNRGLTGIFNFSDIFQSWSAVSGWKGCTTPIKLQYTCGFTDAIYNEPQLNRLKYSSTNPQPLFWIWSASEITSSLYLSII